MNTPAHASVDIQPASVCAVVVTYHPDVGRLLALLEALGGQVACGYVINNGSTLPVADEHLAEMGFACMHLGRNLGVAHALNVGMQAAIEAGAGFVLLSDQDSVPAPGMVSALLQAHEALQAKGRPVGALGPVQIDQRTGTKASFTRPIRYRWVPCLPSPGETLEVDHLITSGCLVPVAALQKVGWMREDLFIDYVDIEWCQRCRFHGLGVYANGSAILHHALGDNVLPVFGMEVPMHSAVRHYYLIRNGVALLRSPFIRRGWKLHDIKLMLTRFVFYSLFSRPQWQHCWYMIRGISDGLRNRMGAFRP